jgi:hypothetical protein
VQALWLHTGERMTAKITRQNVIDTLPCFGHYATMHCYNQGFLQYRRDPLTGILKFPRCPFERLCKKDALKYHENMDVVESGQIDRPREIIKILKK